MLDDALKLRLSTSYDSLGTAFRAPFVLTFRQASVASYKQHASPWNSTYATQELSLITRYRPGCRHLDFHALVSVETRTKPDALERFHS